MDCNCLNQASSISVLSDSSPDMPKSESPGNYSQLNENFQDNPDIRASSISKYNSSLSVSNGFYSYVDINGFQSDFGLSYEISKNPKEQTLYSLEERFPAKDIYENFHQTPGELSPQSSTASTSEYLSYQQGVDQYEYNFKHQYTLPIHNQVYFQLIVILVILYII